MAKSPHLIGMDQHNLKVDRNKMGFFLIGMKLIQKWTNKKLALAMCELTFSENSRTSAGHATAQSLFGIL